MELKLRETLAQAQGTSQLSASVRIPPSPSASDASASLPSLDILATALALQGQSLQNLNPLLLSALLNPTTGAVDSLSSPPKAPEAAKETAAQRTLPDEVLVTQAQLHSEADAQMQAQAVARGQAQVQAPARAQAQDNAQVEIQARVQKQSSEPVPVQAPGSAQPYNQAQGAIQRQAAAPSTAAHPAFSLPPGTSGAHLFLTQFNMPAPPLTAHPAAKTNTAVQLQSVQENASMPGAAPATPIPAVTPLTPGNPVLPSGDVPALPWHMSHLQEAGMMALWHNTVGASQVGTMELWQHAVGAEQAGTMARGQSTVEAVQAVEALPLVGGVGASSHRPASAWWGGPGAGLTAAATAGTSSGNGAHVAAGTISGDGHQGSGLLQGGAPGRQSGGGPSLPVSAGARSGAPALLTAAAAPPSAAAAGVAAAGVTAAGVAAVTAAGVQQGHTAAGHAGRVDAILNGAPVHFAALNGAPVHFAAPLAAAASSAAGGAGAAAAAAAVSVNAVSSANASARLSFAPDAGASAVEWGSDDLLSQPLLLMPHATGAHALLRDALPTPKFSTAVPATISAAGRAAASAGATTAGSAVTSAAAGPSRPSLPARSPASSFFPRMDSEVGGLIEGRHVDEEDEEDLEPEDVDAPPTPAGDAARTTSTAMAAGAVTPGVVVPGVVAAGVVAPGAVAPGGVAPGAVAPGVVAAGVARAAAPGGGPAGMPVPRSPRTIFSELSRLDTDELFAPPAVAGEAGLELVPPAFALPPPPPPALASTPAAGNSAGILGGVTAAAAAAAVGGGGWRAGICTVSQHQSQQQEQQQQGRTSVSLGVMQVTARDVSLAGPSTHVSTAACQDASASPFGESKFSV